MIVYRAVKVGDIVHFNSEGLRAAHIKTEAEHKAAGSPLVVDAVFDPGPFADSLNFQEVELLGVFGYLFFDSTHFKETTPL